MAETRYSIGYALLPKKQRSFLQDSLIELCSSHGIDLFRIDLERPLGDQGPFDCILHKFHGDDWRRQLDDFIAKNRNAVILDAPDAIQRLHNRISMLQVISELKVDSETESFGIPNQIVIYDQETLLEKQPWVVLKFPVIAKPLVADGSAKSHKMSLVFNHDGLNKIKPPIVLQEFVNHGGVIFKVYVVGSHVKCVKRKSLPDVAEDELGSMESLSFSQVSNLSSKEKINNFYRLMQLDDTQMPPQGFISEIARELRKALKLNLFNFDVIRDSRNENRYLIIDINYFPGYAKMPGYEKVVTDFFCDIANNRESGEAQCSVEDDGAQPSSSQSKPMN